MRILLADDDPLIVRCLSRALQALGHTPVPAFSVDEALPLLPAVEAAIVDGFGGEGILLLEFCRQWGFPAVLFSGDADLVERAQAAGYTATCKPKGIETLLYLLEYQSAAVEVTK